jgi:lysophospholipase L1-like esterase
VLLGILPRGERAEDPLRIAARDVNREIAELGDEQHVFYRDLEAWFVDAAGRAHTEHLAGDHLHLTPAGYAAWAEALEPLLGQWLGGSSASGAQL